MEKGFRGFTLIELVLMVAIIATLSVAALSLFPDVGGAKSEAAARKLVSDLTYARHLARARNAVYGISFDTLAETYTVYLLDSSSGAETPVTDPLTRQPMTVDYSNLSGLTGVDLQSALFGTTPEIRFTPQGIPQDGTGTALTAEGSVSVAEGASVRTVSVQPETGEVSQP